MFGIRSILAILVGAAIAIGIILGGATFLETNNPAFDTRMGGRIVLLGLAGLGGLAGGFLAATIAAGRRRLHAILLGVLLCGYWVGRHFFFPAKDSLHDPLWFSYGLAVAVLITSSLGGMVRSRN